MGTKLELNGYELGGGAKKMRETFASDVEAFIGYLESNYGRSVPDKKLMDKFFRVSDALPKAVKKHYDGIALSRLNSRTPIPLALAQIASHASRYADVNCIVLEPDSEDKWELRVWRSGEDDFRLVITWVGDGEYCIEGTEEDGRTLHSGARRGIELLDSHFGRRNLGAARKIDTMFYVAATVYYYDERWSDSSQSGNFIVSCPFSTRAEAESHMASLEQNKAVKNFVREFLPPGLDIDSVGTFDILDPKV